VILADTSIWIEFFRGKNRRIAAHFMELLDADLVMLAAPVKIEILAGSSRSNLAKLRRVLSALPNYYPERGAWETIDRWLDAAILAGERFGFGDLLIGAIAVQQKATLWSLDSDFQRMQKLGWLSLHQV
jgi:predicted nucleic acid-binding protein